MTPFEIHVPVALHLDQGDSLTDLAVMTNPPVFELRRRASAAFPFQNFGASNLNSG
jgi:hypothetical protein